MSPLKPGSVTNSQVPKPSYQGSLNDFGNKGVSDANNYRNHDVPESESRFGVTVENSIILDEHAKFGR